MGKPDSKTNKIIIIVLECEY